MDDEWVKNKREVETAIRVSMRLQEKAYFLNTLALMEIAEQLTEIAKKLPSPWNQPE